MPREQTYIMIKPDGVQRGLVGEIVGRFEAKGFKLVAMKMASPSQAHLESHYCDLKSKKFFPSLISYMLTGPVVAMVWEGDNAVKTGRKMLGATNPADSEPGTIRGDLCVDIGRNICHGSDTVENAKKEITLWFPEGLNAYKHHSESWVYENVEEEAQEASNATAADDSAAFSEWKCYDDDACIGAAAPVLETLKIMQGEAVVYGDKPTVVLFWAKFLKWQVFPALKACEALHLSGKVKVVGIATDPKESAVSRHIQKGECPVTFALAYDKPVGLGKPGSAKGSFKAICEGTLQVPQVFLIDADGKIVLRQPFSSGAPLADSGFLEQVDRHLAGEPLKQIGASPENEEEEEDDGAGEDVVEWVDPLSADVQW